MRRALVRALRTVRLIEPADALVGAWRAMRASAENTAYRRAHPGRPFPDPRLIYEIQSHARLAEFDRAGAIHAEAIAALLSAAGAPHGAAILDWGCGPARVLAHLPAALADPALRLQGCDVHAGAIAWAVRAHPEIGFTRIDASPPTPYPAAAFDAIYGISILTHLGEAAAAAWVGELARLLKPRGLAILTAHGERAAARLAPDEKRRFDSGAYIGLAGARAGSRVFAAYMNEAAGRRLFAPAFADVALLTDGPASAIGQNVWVLRRPRSPA